MSDEIKSATQANLSLDFTRLTLVISILLAACGAPPSENTPWVLWQREDCLTCSHTWGIEASFTTRSACTQEVHRRAEEERKANAARPNPFYTGYVEETDGAYRAGIPEGYVGPGGEIYKSEDVGAGRVSAYRVFPKMQLVHALCLPAGVTATGN
jgi:hypothetical protein